MCLAVLSRGTFAQGGYAPAGYAQPGYAQPAYAQPGYAQPGPVPQLRSTASEQLADPLMDLGAAPEPVLAQDPPIIHAATSARTEPAMADERPAPRPQAAPPQAAAPRTQPPAASPDGRGQSSSLFAPPEKIGTLSSAPKPRAEPHRSLFGRVTGVLGFRHVAPEPDPQAEPVVPAEIVPASEPVGPTVRQTTAEDIGIGIPKFLLRQTSTATAPPRR